MAEYQSPLKREVPAGLYILPYMQYTKNELVEARVFNYVFKPKVPLPALQFGLEQIPASAPVAGAAAAPSHSPQLTG